MRKVKLFEEYFWQMKDNDIADKIISKLNDGINVNRIIKQEGVMSVFYNYTINNENKGDKSLDPYGEDIYEEEGDIIIIASSTIIFGTPFNNYEVQVTAGEKTIKLKSNKSMIIYFKLRNAYKKEQKRLRNVDRNNILNNL